MRKLQIGGKEAKLLPSKPLGSGRTPNPNGKNGAPFTLAPLTFDQALRKILQASPEPKSEPKKKRPAKRKK